MTLILVVDDEAAIRQMLRTYLEAEGFEVAEANNGAAALHAVASLDPALVLLDLSMPGLDGLEVLRQVRSSSSDVPVIVVSARGEELDRVLGLAGGADDYVTKPFSPRELTLRIRSVLRRSGSAGTAADEVMRFDGLEIDTVRREVRCGEQLVDLTSTEFDLLAVLAASPGRVYTRRQLLENVWGLDHFGDDRLIDVHLRNLRRSLGDDANDPAIVATVRGVGYKCIARPK